MSESHPRISVVTPSYNQAAFLETTMLSVLGQRYADLEYVVMDGGSSDASAAIIQRYAGELAFWVSERDGGQAEAINRGFKRATGQILGWLNSDDYYLPGTLQRVAELLGPKVNEPVVVAGGSVVFRDREPEGILVYPPKFDAARLRQMDYLVQPSTFWTSAAWEKVGPLDASLHFGFDWDWFVRASECCEFIIVPELFSGYRQHAAHKSGGGGDRRREEVMAVIRRHASAATIAHYEWLMEHPGAWSDVRRWRDARAMCQRRGWPELLATLSAPKLWSLPAPLTRSDLVDCLEAL